MSTILRGEMTRKLIEPFPPQAIQTRQGGGGKRLSYVEGHTVIHRLIAATDNQFDLRVLSVEQKGDLLTALVELTIPGLGSRQHMGVQKVAPNGGEDLVKGAITDAMKKAATLFGVGLELYGPDYEADDQTPPARDTRAAPNAPTRPAAPPPAAAGHPQAYVSPYLRSEAAQPNQYPEMTWAEFKKWARPLGYDSRAECEKVIKLDTTDWLPGQIRTGLETRGVESPEPPAAYAG